MGFMLDAGNAAAYLAGRGLIGPAEAGRARAALLGGGVSNTVVRVDVPEASGGGGRSLVLKQSLPRLRVAGEWYADRERICREWAAAEYLGGVLPPSAVPQVVDTDRGNWLFVMTAAPEDGVNWKEALLAGVVDVGVAARVGSMLGIIHRRSAVAAGGAGAIPPDLREFADRRGFVQLRIDPYHRAAAAAHPELAAAIEAEAQRMLAQPRVLVHGDYSPKNIIVSGGGGTGSGGNSDDGGGNGDGAVFLLDFEVAHLGNPVFDLAFLLNHLTLKAIRRPQLAGEYNGAARAFWGAYRDAAGDIAGNGGTAAESERASLERDTLERDTLRQLGALLLARVDGKSPVEYIVAEGQKAQARRLARELLAGGIAGLAELHCRLGASPASAPSPELGRG